MPELGKIDVITSEQPVCVGVDEATGELIWEMTPMEMWQKLLFASSYRGDFTAEWLMIILYQKAGMDWIGEEAA